MPRIGSDSLALSLLCLNPLNQLQQSKIMQCNNVPVSFIPLYLLVLCFASFLVLSRAQGGDFVICCYDGAGSRAEAYQANEQQVAVGFIDYGNVHAAYHKDVLPLPREFSTLPTIAAKIHLEGVTDFAEETQKNQAAAMLKVISKYCIVKM